MATDPRWIDEHGNEIDEDHRGLVYDIRTLVDRRRALGDLANSRRWMSRCRKFGGMWAVGGG